MSIIISVGEKRKQALTGGFWIRRVSVFVLFCLIVNGKCSEHRFELWAFGQRAVGKRG